MPRFGRRPKATPTRGTNRIHRQRKGKGPRESLAVESRKLDGKEGSNTERAEFTEMEKDSTATSLIFVQRVWNRLKTKELSSWRMQKSAKNCKRVRKHLKRKGLRAAASEDAARGELQDWEPPHPLFFDEVFIPKKG